VSICHAHSPVVRPRFALAAGMLGLLLAGCGTAGVPAPPTDGAAAVAGAAAVTTEPTTEAPPTEAPTTEAPTTAAPPARPAPPRVPPRPVPPKPVHPRPAPPRPASPKPPAASGCDPAYPTVCLRDGIGDYDCEGGSGNGPNYVGGPIKVLPPDPFGLDKDHDGIGCE
jgi:hypothetical protein